MGHWDHRIVREVSEHLGKRTITYTIVEMHYDDEGVPWGYGRADISHSVEDEDDNPDPLPSLREQLAWLQKALDQPILDAAADLKGKAPGAGLKDEDFVTLSPDEELVIGEDGDE